MKKIRFFALLLLSALLLPTLFSCSLLPKKTEEGLLDCALTVYENDDYNFEFTYPSLFKTVTVTDSTENKDESVIEFKLDDTDYITMYCMYNPEDDFYSFMKAKNFDTELMYSVNPNVFVYDRRNPDIGEKPAYYLIGCTRRMVYITEYTFNKGNDVAYAVCDRLSFDFTYYANTPKENASLSSEIVLAGGYLKLRLPGNAVLDFYPKPENTETTTQAAASGTESGEETAEEPVSYLTYSKVVASGREYIGAFYANAVSYRFTSEELQSGVLDAAYQSLISVLTEETIKNAQVDEKAVYRTASGSSYSILTFTCTYNGHECSGTVMAGYGARGQYFEFVYAISDDAPDGEFTNYSDMLESISM